MVTVICLLSFKFFLIVFQKYLWDFDYSRDQKHMEQNSNDMHKCENSFML